jgi:PAS domain S-box-containing protein
MKKNIDPAILLRLKASEEKYRTFFENSIDAILITSQDGRIFSANRAACKMLGWDEKDIIRLGRKGIVAQSPQLDEALAQRNTTGKYFGEAVFIRKDGTRFTAEISSSVFIYDGQELAAIIARDITERKNTEKALQLSEERMRLAGKATGFGTYSFDFQSGDAFYSDEFLSLYGLSHGQTLELDSDFIAKALWPDDKPGFLTEMNKANNPSGSGILDFEYRIILPQGKIRWIKVRGLTSFTGNTKEDRPIMANGIIQDITDRKMTETALKESEARFRNLFNNSLVGISVTLPSGKILEANNAYAKMYGYDSPQQLYNEVSDIRQLYAHKSDRENVLKSLCASGKMEEREIELVRRDGSKFYVLVTANEVRDTDGNFIYNQATHIDLTERKKNEEKVRNASLYARSLIEASLDPLITINSEGKITDVNKSTEEITGVKREELVGSDFESYFADERRARKGYKTVFSQGYVKNYPLSILHKNGRRIEVMFNASLFRNVSGEVQGVLAAARDITENKRMEEEVLNSKKLLENLNQHLLEVRENERSEIALNLHDDLGQRLTAINLDVAWLKGRVGVQTQVVMNKFRDISKMINETVDGIKEISSFLRPAILYDLGIVTAFEWQLRSMEKNSGIKYIFNHSLSEIKINDRISLILYRVLQESLTNVVRHAEATIVKVSLNVTKNEAVLSIEDNGKGIEAKKLNALTSMGITGIKERVSSVSGKVNIHGKKNKGTTVLVLIPLKFKSKS